jgi:crotonobetainyl-CoA:carnitine CoA-transferase CaiB-like acyl-CoA transferase
MTALEGVRILDFTWWVVGPWAARLLAPFGAEVIKVERPDEYEGMRRSVLKAGTEINPERSPHFSTINADKHAIKLNVRNPRGFELAKELIARSDAVVENFSAGVMASWGLGWEQLQEINPKLVYVSMSGFGHSGPTRHFRSYGPTAQAVSGLTFTSGLPGRASAGWGFSYMDVLGGFFGSLALAQGLYYARRTGKGIHLDHSIIESGMMLLGTFFLDFDVNGRRTRRPDFPPGNRALFPPVAPHNTYRCMGRDRLGQDQWVFIACETDEQFANLCMVIQDDALARDSRFASNAGRREHQDELDAAIERWTSVRPRYEVMERCQQHGVIAAVVQNAEDRLEFDPHLRAREVYPVLPHPVLGDKKYEGYPVKLSRTPARMRRGAPLWGEDNRAIYSGLLGLSDEEIARLERDEVI